MASTATAAADRLADHLGCTARVAGTLPGELPPVPRFTDAYERPGGTCSWYRPEKDNGVDQIWLPDEAMAAPADPLAWRERCALRLTPDSADRLFNTAFADTKGTDDGDAPAPEDTWWVDVQSFYGQETPDVRTGDADSPLTPGTAGRDADGALWWATTVCDGSPAVHVLRARYGRASWSRQAAPHLEGLFRSYAHDVAARRSCTGLEFPAGSTFRAP